MNRIKLWGCNTPTYESLVCVSKGVAIDRSYKQKSYNAELCTDTPLESLENNLSLYSASLPVNGTMVYTPWFLSEEECYNFITSEYPETKKTDITNHRGTLVKDVYEEPGDEFVARIEKSPQGYYARIITKPNEFGRNNMGKLFFPDKSWNKVCTGTALVSIYKDMDRYGFITGKMMDFGFDDTEAILDFVKNTLDTYTNIAYVAGSLHGSFYMVTYSQRVWYRIYPDKQGKLGTIRVLSCDYEGIQDSIAWEKSYIDFLMDEQYADFVPEDLEYASASEMIRAMFAPSMFHAISGIEGNAFRVKEDWTKAEHEFPEVIAKAIDDGIMVGLQLGNFGIYSVALTKNGLTQCVMKPWDELKELSEQFSQINQEADNAIRANTRKGRIHLR